MKIDSRSNCFAYAAQVAASNFEDQSLPPRSPCKALLAAGAMRFLFFRFIAFARSKLLQNPPQYFSKATGISNPLIKIALEICCTFNKIFTVEFLQLH
jgi:hypothetical protein